MKPSLMLLALALVAGCTDGGGPPAIHGPGPSVLVDTRVAAPGEVVGPSRVDCVGPADEVLALGAVCDASMPPVLGLVNTVGDLSFVVGDTDAGPKLLVLGYFDPTVSTSDHRADIRYAAYLWSDSTPAGHEIDDWYVAATLAQWADATPIAGEIVTDVAEYGCGTQLLARARFGIGNVVVTVYAEVVVGC